jgi:hypothetical protein
MMLTERMQLVVECAIEDAAPFLDGLGWVAEQPDCRYFVHTEHPGIFRGALYIGQGKVQILEGREAEAFV